ncbi:MAG: hypothetical protein ACOYL5_16290 [Phototrophicaceae bacterium]|jgi:hypothetical protein
MRQWLRVLWENPLKWLIVMVCVALTFSAWRFSTLYSGVIPVNDDFNHSAAVAIAVKAGTLGVDDLLRLGDGIHPLLLNHLLTITSTVLVNWHLPFDHSVIMILYIATALLLFYLLHQQHAQAAWIAAIFMTGLVMTLQKDSVWHVPVISLWGLADLLFIIMLALFSLPPNGWRFAVLLGLGFFTSLTAVSGVYAAFVLFPLLVVYGYRRTYQLLLWAGVCVANIAFYLNNPTLNVNANSGGNDLSLAAIFEQFINYGRFAFAVIGRVVSLDATQAIQATWLGIVLLLLCGGYLGWRGQWRAVILWFSLAAWSGASAFVIALGRANRFGIFSSDAPWYVDIITPFWIALIALGALTLVDLLARPKMWARAVAYALIVITVIGAGFFSYRSARAVIFREGKLAVFNPLTDCVFLYPATRDLSCVIGAATFPEYTDALATFGLSVFANHHYSSQLPTLLYRPDAPFVIETESLWYNDSLQRLFLHDLPHGNVINVVSPEAEAQTTLVYNRRPRLPSRDSIQLTDLNTPDQFWVLRQNDLPTPDDWWQDAAYTLMYESHFTFTTHTFTLLGYQRAPQDRTPNFIFGTGIQLLDWELPRGQTLRPCESLPFTSVWQAEQPQALDWKMSFTVTDNGNGIARWDAPLSFGTVRWQPDTPYADWRAITIPCDTPAGQYPLLLTVYDPETGTPLEVFTTTGGLVGTSLYLTDLIIPN